MKLGTQIEINGKDATVVYNSLIGVGIKWGLHNPSPTDFENTDGNTVTAGIPDDWQWEPEALLRDPWANCEECGFNRDQCIGNDYIIIRDGLGDSNER
jgi:hypothetical protein